jgi:hypothetical protein
MRTILTVLAFGLAVSPAFAISRHQAQTLTCQKIQSIIDNEGASIMRYPSARNKTLVLYDRYVSSSQSCGTSEIAVPTSIPSKDSENCPVLHCLPTSQVCEDPTSRIPECLYR